MILSIVIVNWNSKIITYKCLESIYNSKDYLKNEFDYEVILIDNNSTDGSVGFFKKRFPFLILIENKKNLGYAPASNQGMKIAKGEYILLLGNDTILTNDVLTKCVSYMNENEKCAGLTCKLLYPDGKLQGNLMRFPKLRDGILTYLSLHKLCKKYHMSDFNYNKDIEVDQIATTFLMARKSLLEEIGYFNEKYKILYNDVDLCKRISLTGQYLYFLHKPFVYHIGSHSTNKARFNIRCIMYVDIFRYYWNEFGFKALIIVPILITRVIFVSLLKR